MTTVMNMTTVLNMTTVMNHHSDNVTNDDYDDNAYSDTITDDIPTDREVESYSESESSER